LAGHEQLLKTLLKNRGIGMAVLGLIVLVQQSGCSSAPRWGSWSVHPSPVRLAIVMGRPDSYVYFPAYQVYYNRTRLQFVFPSDRGWTTQNDSPGDVGEAELFSSPVVAMNFTDAPQWHHAAVVRAYPWFWGRPKAAIALAH
jgi:hypothetical protein